jgi:3'-5' exonuclease
MEPIMRIYIDIETIPSQQPDARELVKAGIKPPATHKKPETIAAWWENDSSAAIEEAYRKQALDAAAGEIISISWMSDDCLAPTTAIRSHHDDERVVLAQFFGQLQAALEAGAIRDHRGQAIYDDAPFFIAHNASFDLGFLWRRSIILGIRAPFTIPSPTAKPGSYGDTMAAWAGNRGTIGLDRLCTALGVPSPKGEGMDGSKVFDAWLAGELDRIAKYNAADVVATRECWRRLNWEQSAEAAA